MKTLFCGLLFGIVLCLTAEYLFLTRGGMPVVATQGVPLPFERKLAKAAQRHAIGAEAQRPSPVAADAANLTAGARVYREQCAVCHGTWGGQASATAKGMFPSPPQLLPPKKGVTDDPVGETYWKAKNGLRLTGMPGYQGSLTDTQLWQVSLLLLHADQLPASAQEALRQ